MKKVKLIIEAMKEEDEIMIPLHIRSVETLISFDGEPKLIITVIGETKKDIKDWGKLITEVTPV